jgi:tetratricopeptide (TPR) repeat protein
MQHLRRALFSALLLPSYLWCAALFHGQQATGNVIPEDAQRYFVQANTRFHQAQSPDDYREAAALYKQALELAPHFGNAWYNLAKVQEKLEQYDDAIASLKHFLADSPNDPEARTAQDHVYELEALKEKAKRTQEKANGPTWTDPATGLMWTKKDNGSDVTWQQAMDYCQNLQLDGHSDWRLATPAELRDIYDQNVNVGGWHVKGNLQLSGRQWSGSHLRSTGGGFDFADGFGLAYNPSYSTQFRVLCVRRSKE